MIGAASGLFIDFIVGVLFCFFMILVLGLFGLELRDDAVAMGTITGLLVSARIMTVTRRFNPLFLDDQTRLISIVVGTNLGGTSGNVTASAGGLKPFPTIPSASQVR